MALNYVDDEAVNALAELGPQHAAVLYDPTTVVNLAREVKVLRVIAANQHPCECRLAANPEEIDQSIKCTCPCHRRIQEAPIIWNPDQLPQHPDVVEDEPSE